MEVATQAHQEGTQKEKDASVSVSGIDWLVGVFIRLRFVFHLESFFINSEIIVRCCAHFNKRICAE